jgi:hypothetical protein
MATLTISYDGRNRAARAVVEMLRSLDFIHITEPKSKTLSSVDRSLAEFERGETTVCDTFEDYLKSIEA